jgi:hypothetical protein
MVSSRLTAASLTKSTTAASGCYSVCNRSSGSSLVELAHAQQSQCAKYRLFHAVRLLTAGDHRSHQESRLALHACQRCSMCSGVGGPQQPCLL